MDTRAMNARSWRGHCIVCGKDFSYADGFDCTAQPGRHTVEPKAYYHLGAAQVPSVRERRFFTPTLNLQGGIEVRDKVTGEISRTEAILVHFRESGIYETQDALEQYHLDQHPALVSGAEGRAAWDKVYLTQDQQLSKAQSTLADVQRQVREQNALLDITKQRNKGQAA
jgi:hypothetical protein